MPTPPGWYNDDSQGRLRWWDGSGWSDPAADSRFSPGAPTVLDGVRLVFVPDPTWPPAPDGWYPQPMWEPGVGWVHPEDRLWRTIGEDVEDTLVAIPAIADALEHEQHPDVWRFDSRDTVPVVWVPPPNWPKASPGWSPPPKWKPPRQWGRAPTDWQFWQHDPAAIEHRTAHIYAEADARSRSLASTTFGVATLLAHAEAAVCDVARLTPLVLSPLPSAARGGMPVSAPPYLEEALRKIHHHLVWAVSNLRTYLLRTAYGLAEADEWLWQLRRAVVDAREGYQDAAKAAAEGVLNATVSRLEGEMARLSTSPRHAQRRALLGSLAGEIADDIEARTRALRRSTKDSTTDRSAPNSGWEAAEELAAQHVRSLGFPDALRTPVGSDGGFDVEGRGVVAQVKYRATAVGRPDVQRLVGANTHGARPLFYARAGYSQSAVDYANQVGVALFTLDADTSRIEPVNRAARELSSAR